MRDFVITTDSAADLPQSYIEKWGTIVIPLYYCFGSTVYGDELEMTPDEFYARMKGGELPTSQPCNPTVIEANFRAILDQGFDIIHIAFSSALSASYENACMVAKDLLKEYTDARITVIDSLNASLGEGLLVIFADTLRANGATYKEAIWNINQFINHSNALFTVDDLFHLQRGGRISKAVAVVGSALNLKPSLYVSDSGTLCTSGTVLGRKKALQSLISRMKSTYQDYPEYPLPVCITHSNCFEDAQTVANMIRGEIGIPNILISDVCPTIGAHSGPGTIAVFYYGKPKQSAK